MRLIKPKVFFVTIALLLASGTSAAIAVDAPNAPASVAAVTNAAANSLPAAGSLSVTWQKPVVDATHPLPIAYLVSATGGGQTIEATVPLATVATTDYSTVLTGLTGGTSYTVTVTSKSSDNVVTSAAAVTATPITSPGNPTPVSAVASPGSAALTWSAPSNTGGSAITSYVIKDDLDVETTISDTATTKSFSGLSASLPVTYSIKARNANGSSEWVAFQQITLPSVPDKPTGVTGTPNTSSITVTWVAPAINGNSAITGYKVYLYDNAGLAVGNPTAATTTTAEITGVSAGTYTTKVVATNLVGDSPLSTASTAVTIAAPSSLIDNTPVFTPTALVNLVIGGTQSVSVTVPSTEAVTITATGTPAGACTFSAGVLTAVALGTCSVRATSPATSTHAEAIGTKTFTITKTLQSITFASLANQPLPGPLRLSASSTSGLIVAFSASGNCTVSGVTVSFTSQGNCTITASQDGNGSFAAATQVPRTFSITAANVNVNENTNNNGGGGFAGGGGSPGPTPSLSPSPTPTPSATPSGVPTPSGSPTPLATPTVKPTPNSLPSPTTRPGVATNPRGEVTKTTTFAIPTRVTGPVKATTVSGSKASISASLKTAVQPAIPAVKKGTVIKVVVKGADGKSYTIASTKATKSGTYKAPAIKFAKPGTYQVTVMVGKVKKVITYKISK